VVYEAQIRIRRTDPKVLADDFEAVAALLARRKADRELKTAPWPRRRHLELVVSPTNA
jgi:hypothetical protein